MAKYLLLITGLFNVGLISAASVEGAADGSVTSVAAAVIAEYRGLPRATAAELSAAAKDTYVCERSAGSLIDFINQTELVKARRFEPQHIRLQLLSLEIKPGKHGLIRTELIRPVEGPASTQTVTCTFMSVCPGRIRHCRSPLCNKLLQVPSGAAPIAAAERVADARLAERATRLPERGTKRPRGGSDSGSDSE